MRVSDILTQIAIKEGVASYKDIDVQRYIEYKNAPIKSHIDFDEDDDFENFVDHLNKIFISSVYRSCAVKILNNGFYI